MSKRNFSATLRDKQKIMKTLIQILSFWDCFGFKGIISLFRKVSWIQDINLANNGIDIISFDKNAGYFTGTYFQMRKFTNP